jgi:hypothetical protein
MKRILTIVLSCSSLVSAASAAKPTAGPAFAGTLTTELVMASKDAVHPLQPWDEAFAKLQSQLGKPTKVDGKRYYWAATQGDDCVFTYVERDDGKEYKVDGFVVGGVSPPLNAKSGTNGVDQDDCLEAAGKGKPEDPSALPPPTDGKPIAPKLVLDNAVKAPSKWTGAQVAVTGTLNGVGGIAVMIGDDAKATETLDCIVKQAPDDALMGKPVIAKGTIKMEKWTSGGSAGHKLKAALDPCELSAK